MNPESPPLQLLAVEDSMRDARLLRELLRDADTPAQMIHVQTLEAAAAELAGRRFDCVLLDLGLPDGDGVENVERIRRCDREVAIVVLTGRDDQQSALQALRRGAQEYAVKGEHDGESLLRVVQHAIERNRLLAQLDNQREQEYFKASHDALTGLPNRQLFLDRAHVALTHAERAGGRLAICFIDLDGFKQVNDTRGHATGDALLRQVAQVLLDTVREGDTIARVGGDEFVILLTTAPDRDGAELAAQRIIERIRAIDAVDGAPVVIGASAGIALYPEHAPTLPQLLTHADSAMYQAKRAGKNTMRVYAPPEHAPAPLHGAATLNENMLTLSFQPWVNARTGEFAGLESFVRSSDGREGAGEVLRQARQNSWLDALGRWVLQQACREWLALRDLGLSPPRISVNISASELESRDFAATRLSIIEQSGVPPSMMLIEVPEGCLDGAEGVPRIAQLRELAPHGVGIVLDNFGRHEGSLRRIERLPLALVKLDASLLVETRQSRPAAVIIAGAAIRLAQALGLEAVVTGVESAADHAAAIELGTAFEQGFWLAGPVTAEGLPKILSRVPAQAVA